MLSRKLNIFGNYKKYNLPLWQYPPFIFFILGFIIIGVILFTYFIGTRYLEPEWVSLIVIALAIILLALDYIIVNSFQGLADANLMKSEFMNIISHQLKTPLTNLKWTVGLAVTEKDPTKDQYYFGIIREQNDRMLKLINNMLIASRLEQQRWPSKKESVDLKKIIEKIVKKGEFVIKANNIKLEVSLENVPSVLVDSQKISQAVENLIDNAVQYSKEGDSISIKLENKKSFVKFSVRDTGVGIPQEEQKNIFRKFFRSQNVLRFQTQGLGLSLFIVKAIVDEFKGKVDFKSKEGKGTTFWFELPVK